MKPLAYLLFVLIVVTAPADAFIRGGFSNPPSGITTFTPLHTYFMSSTGSDSNNGLSAGAPWLTPNHAAIVCGDVIIAATGTYDSNNLQVTQTPGTCPSTSGGIDGTGGVYAAIILCGGNVGTCNATDTHNSRSFNFSASFWSVQGWQVSNPGNVDFAQNCSSSTLFHHLSFINDIANNTGSGFSFGECGGTGSWDYVAVVGSIAQDANTSSACTSAFNFVTPKVFDTNAGTHIYAYSNYGIANPGNVGCASDGNGLIFDTLDLNSYTQQGVVENNIIFSSRQFGLHIFSQELTAVAPVVKVFNNTVFNSGTSPATGSNTIPEITEWNNKFTQITQNNIAMTGAGSRGSADLYAFQAGGNGGLNSNATVGGTGNENIFKASSGVCQGGSSTCDAGFNVVAFNGNSFGTNTYTNPTFSNTTDLLANQAGTPACTSFENVTQCMGYNATTTTLTTLSVIGDLAASCAGCTGKGFQLPSLACNTNADFPVWIKGLVYLHWTGSGVQQKQGLATTPCGL